jgi:hypothetical protein
LFITKQPISYKDIIALCNNDWISDTVINFYLFQLLINLKKMQVIEMFLQAVIKSKYQAFIIYSLTSNKIMDLNADVLTRAKLRVINILNYL